MNEQLQKIVDRVKGCTVSDDLKGLNEDFSNTIKQAQIYADFLTHESGEVNTVSFPLRNDEWEKYSEFNVDAILCSLNDVEKDITVINVKFKKGGFIPPLKHDRHKSVFVIQGEVEDIINNKKFKQNEVYYIPPDTIHSLKSDDCLLTITWIPAYEMV